MSKNHESLQVTALNFIETKNERTFRKLIDRLRPGLYNFIYKYVKDRSLCNDVLSQTFISIWEKSNQYKPQYNFSTWVYAIAKNEALGILRNGNKLDSYDKLASKGSIKLNTKSIIVHMNLSELDNHEPTLEAIYNRSIDIINNLEEPYRTVIIEREINNKHLQDIADQLGWNLSTVKTRLRKARALVAEHLKNNYSELLESYHEEYS